MTVWLSLSAAFPVGDDEEFARQLDLQREEAEVEPIYGKNLWPDVGLVHAGPDLPEGPRPVEHLFDADTYLARDVRFLVRKTA